MNQSYLNGPFQELNKRFPILVKIIAEKRYPSSLHQGINYLRFAYCYIRYLWSKSDGPVFMFKLWMLILDRLFGNLYPFNRNPICRSPNHSSVLSKKQNIGWFFKCSVLYVIYMIHEGPPILVRILVKFFSPSAQDSW